MPCCFGPLIDLIGNTVDGETNLGNRTENFQLEESDLAGYLQDVRHGGDAVIREHWTEIHLAAGRRIWTGDSCALIFKPSPFLIHTNNSLHLARKYTLGYLSADIRAYFQSQMEAIVFPFRLLLSKYIISVLPSGLSSAETSKALAKLSFW